MALRTCNSGLKVVEPFYVKVMAKIIKSFNYDNLRNHRRLKTFRMQCILCQKKYGFAK